MSQTPGDPVRSRGPRPIVLLAAGLLTVAGVCPVSGSWRPPGRMVEVYEPSSDQWAGVRRMPVAIAGARCAEIGGVIYVAGGTNRRDQPGAQFLRYDPMAATWEVLADIPTARQGHDVVAFGTELWVMGGFHAADRSVEVFDVVSGSWSVAPDLPTPRSGHRIVEVGGIFYVMGGRPEIWSGNEVDTFEAFDPVSGSWQTLPPMPYPASDFVAETDGAFIYIIGGSNWGHPHAEVRIYDPGAGSWTPAPPLPEEGNYLESAVIGQEIFVVGAFGEQSPDRYRFGEDRRRLFSYGMMTGVWTERRRRSRYLFEVGAAASGGRLYVFGGRGRTEER